MINWKMLRENILLRILLKKKVLSHLEQMETNVHGKEKIIIPEFLCHLTPNPFLLRVWSKKCSPHDY